MGKANNIFRRVLWFDKKEKFDLDGLYEYIQPQRTVSNKPRYKNDIFYSEKCGRGIQYESGLELKFIKDQLENNDAVRFYCEQPRKLPFWRGKIKAGYYPDFIVYLRSGYIVLVEVKPLDEMLTHRVQAKIEGMMEFCSKRGFGLLLTDGNRIPSDLAKGKVNRSLEKELKMALAKGPIYEPHWKQIKKRCDAKPSELYRAIIRLDLKYATRRFKLQDGRQSPMFRQVYFDKRRYDDLILNNVSDWFRTRTGCL